MKALKIMIHTAGVLYIFQIIARPYLNENPTWFNLIILLIVSFIIYPFIIKFYKEK